MTVSKKLDQKSLREDAKQILGHKSGVATERYYRLNPAKIVSFTFDYYRNP